MLLLVNKLIKKKKNLLILILILIVSALVRLINVSKMAPFDFDQEYAANFAYAVIKIFPVRLIGQGLSVQGLFMGPLYFYYLVPFYAVFSLHPIGGVIGSIVLGLITVAVYYWIGKRFFGEAGGLVLAFLRAILFYKVQGDWSVIPSMSSELVVIVSWYCLWKLWNKEDKYLPLLTFCFGLYTSFHPILFPFYIVLIVLLIIRRYLPNIKTIGLSIVTFIIPLSPLILFEFLHNFLEIKRLFSMGGDGAVEHASIKKLVYFLGVNAREPNLIFGLSMKTNWLPFVAFCIVSLVLILMRVGFWKNKFNSVMLPITFTIFVVYYTLFPTHVPEYYFLGVSVLVFFYIGGLISLLVKKKIMIPIFIIIIFYLTFINFRELRRAWNYPSPAALYNKDQIVKEIAKVQPKDKEFYVSYIKEPGWNFGFDYLFKYYGIIPQTREAKKPIYTIVIPKALSLGSLNFISGNIGLIFENK